MPRALALTVLLLIPLAAGCASPWKRECIFRGDDVYLYREHREADGSVIQENFAHPATVGAADLSALLTALKYDVKKVLRSPEVQSLFSPEEVREAAEPMSLALAAVSPHERVRFLVIRDSVGKILLGLSGVSGVLFVRDGTLHLALDTIDGGIHEGDGGRPEDVSFPYDPIEERPSYGLHASIAGSRLHRDPESGDICRAWLEIGLDDLQAFAQRTRDERATEALASDDTTSGGVAATDPTATPRPDPQRDDLPPAGDPPPSPAATSGDGRPSTPPIDPRVEEVSRKLRALKALRDRGDLSEDEYQREYERVMSEL